MADDPQSFMEDSLPEKAFSMRFARIIMRVCRLPRCTLKARSVISRVAVAGWKKSTSPILCRMTSI